MIYEYSKNTKIVVKKPPLFIGWDCFVAEPPRNDGEIEKYRHCERRFGSEAILTAKERLHQPNGILGACQKSLVFTLLGLLRRRASSQ